MKWILVLLLIAGGIVGFIIANDPDVSDRVFKVYFPLIAFSFAAYLGLKQFLKLPSIDFKNQKHIFLSIGLGAAFIFLNALNPFFSIGIPLAITSGLSLIGIFLVVVGVAVIVEEIFFAAMDSAFRKIWKNDIISLLLTGLLFSFYHIVAYGADLANLADTLQAFNVGFLGAFAFRVVVTYFVRRTNNVLIGIITHLMFNAFLFAVAQGYI